MQDQYRYPQPQPQYALTATAPPEPSSPGKQGALRVAELPGAAPGLRRESAREHERERGERRERPLTVLGLQDDERREVHLRGVAGGGGGVQVLGLQVLEDDVDGAQPLCLSRPPAPSPALPPSHARSCALCPCVLG
jgi:hypothetical protein